MKRTYEPREDSFFLLDSVKEPITGRLLEMGVGRGFILLNLMKKNALDEGFGTDIDIDALIETENSSNGCLLNLVLCDCASAFRASSFDVVVFNPPYLIGHWKEDRTIFGKRGGTWIPYVMLQDAIRLIKPSHNVFFILSSESEVKELFDLAKGAGEIEELHRKRFFFEELIVYRFTRLTD